MKVAISKCSNVNDEIDITLAMKNLLDEFGGISSLIKPGQLVMVKPNLVIPTKEPGIITNKLVLKAIIKEVLNIPKCKVVIGESVGVGRDAIESFKENGTVELADELGVELIDLGKTETKLVSFPNHPVIKKLEISKLVFEVDYLINLPVMKTHMHTRVSLSLKNLKGCLPHKSMKEMHLGGVDIGLHTLNKIIKPNLNIVDGTIASEGMGPVHGQPKQMNCLIASESAFACDIVTCALMGVSPYDVKHLVYANEIYGESIDLDDYDYDKQLLEHLKSDFIMPPTNLQNAYGANVIDRDTCSGCASAIIGALARLEINGDLELIKDATIVVGQSIKKQDYINYNNLIFVGSCLRRIKEDSNLYIPGCPPPDWDIMGRIYRSCNVKMKECFWEDRINKYHEL